MLNLRIPTFLGSLLLAGSVGYVFAQQQQPAPRGNSVGVKSTELAKVDLGLYFPEMKGKVMRMNLAEVDASGGSVVPHSHRGHPELVYMLTGTMTEKQGSEEKSLKPGEAMLTNANLNEMHRFLNLGKEKASLLSISIVTTPAR